MPNRIAAQCSLFAGTAALTLALVGCQAGTPSATTHDASTKPVASGNEQQGPHAVDPGRELLAARHRLDAAEGRVTSIRVKIKRFLTTRPLDSIEEKSSEAALQVQRLVLETNELQKAYNSLRSTYDVLLQRQAEGSFEPSDQELAEINASEEIKEIDRALRGLRLEEAALLVEHKEDDLEVRKIRAKMQVLTKERNEELDQKARVLFNAKLEQAATGVNVLGQEIARAQQALAEWTVRRQDSVILLQEYDSLVRELQAAEQERENAARRVADLTELQQSR